MQKIIWVIGLLACMGCRPSTLEWGKELLAEKKYEKAKEALSLWIQCDTTRWDAYYARAECNAALSLENDALHDYEKAFAMHPAVKTCVGVGKGYLENEDYEKAKAYFNRAIGMDRSDARGYFGLGDCYQREEMYDEALSYLHQAQARWKKNVPEEFTLALMQVYFEKKQDAACLEQIRILKLAKSPRSEAYEYAGRVYARQKRYPQALKEYQAVLDRDSTDIVARVLVADVFAQQEQFAAEIKVRTRIITQVEGQKADADMIGLSYYLRGMAKDNAGDFRGALRDLDYSISISDGRAWAYFCRTVAKIHLRDFSGALRDYQEAVRLRPDVAFDDHLSEDPTSYATFIAYAGMHGERID
ncbi:MAG: tetratricopeptide repeat protein [Cytophagaceae bacterium]|nr:tetratricopeptide repeat protein [Cytophagaceae bacterium]